MSQQPEALRLAEALERNRILPCGDNGNPVKDAATELRRLHATNTELLDELKAAHQIVQHALAVMAMNLDKQEKIEMSDTTKTPRAHAELAARYMTDDSLKCWSWMPSEKLWVENVCPTWHYNVAYHVGHRVPTAPPKRKVTIAGITFDAPETEAPKVGMKYWLIDIDRANSMVWSGSPVEQRWLAAGLAHLDYENARLHTQALIKLNRQLCGMGELLRKEDSND